MKSYILTLVLCLITIIMKGQSDNPKYDSSLAKELGADEYGMKWYVMVILKTGSNQIEDKVEREKLFAGHFQTIRRLSDEGKLIVAGPFGVNENEYRGIFILDVESLEDAGELLQSDPTIRENVFEANLFKWYGSAALPAYLETHKKVEKSRIE